MGTSLIAASLAKLIAQLESYWLEKLKEQKPETVPVKILSPQEKATAEIYLKLNPKSGSGLILLEKKAEDLEKIDIVRETRKALIFYLAIGICKYLELLIFICLAYRRIGKSYLLERVPACIPPEELLQNLSLPKTVFINSNPKKYAETIFWLKIRTKCSKMTRNII